MPVCLSFAEILKQLSGLTWRGAEQIAPRACAVPGLVWSLWGELCHSPVCSQHSCWSSQAGGQLRCASVLFLKCNWAFSAQSKNREKKKKDASKNDFILNTLNLLRFLKYTKSRSLIAIQRRLEKKTQLLVQVKFENGHLVMTYIGSWVYMDHIFPLSTHISLNLSLCRKDWFILCKSAWVLSWKTSGHFINQK